MIPHFDINNLKQKQPWEMGVRFAFGGLITAAAHLVAEAFGPGVAGLFLAFPAILPASLTLIYQHEGPRGAAEDALGALPGSVALGLFAVCVWQGFAHNYHAALVVLAAALLWAGSAALLWWAFIPNAHKKR